MYNHILYVHFYDHFSRLFLSHLAFFGKNKSMFSNMKWYRVFYCVPGTDERKLTVMHLAHSFSEIRKLNDISETKMSISTYMNKRLNVVLAILWNSLPDCVSFRQSLNTLSKLMKKISF